MSWPFVMLFQNIAAAVFALYSRRIAHHFHNAAMPLNAVNYGIIALSGFMYAVWHGLHLVSLHALGHFLGFFIFAGLCFAITNILSFVVFEYVDAAIGSLLALFNIIAAVILSTLLIRESLTIREFAGALIIFASMHLILSINVTKYRHKRLWIAVGLSIIASLFFALAATTEKYLLNNVNVSTYLTFGWGFQFVGIATLSLIFAQFADINFALLKKPKFLSLAVQAGVVRMLSGLLFIFSLKLSNNLSIISVFSGLKVILVALFAGYTLREKEFIKRKIQAALLAMLGVAVMLWK